MRPVPSVLVVMLAAVLAAGCATSAKTANQTAQPNRQNAPFVLTFTKGAVTYSVIS